MDIEKILQVAIRGGASDIILKTGAIPRVRFNGSLVALSNAPTITSEIMQKWIAQMVPPHLQSKINDLIDLDFAFQSTTQARFRVNVFRQKQSFAMVMRLIQNHVRTIEELQLPPILEKIALEKRGLVLVTGATGSGKTTTLAAMIEKINTVKPSHIVTIEDPIEFVYEEKLSTINQREVGQDTPSFTLALRSALRQNPDVILVGELRDAETIETALMAAETGHLVLSTLHTLDAVESVTRLLSYFPPHQYDSVKLTLAQVLKAVISQRLLPRIDRKGMIAATEILVNNEGVREQIITAKDFKMLKDMIKRGNDGYGMQTFDQSLLAIFMRGAISREEAVAQASNKNDFELALRGIGK